MVGPIYDGVSCHNITFICVIMSLYVLLQVAEVGRDAIGLRISPIQFR